MKQDMTVILSVFFALVCALLAAGLFIQTRRWNLIMRATDWPQSICGYGLASLLGVASVGLSLVAWVAAA
jgi:hypothetical protein